VSRAGLYNAEFTTAHLSTFQQDMTRERVFHKAHPDSTSHGFLLFSDRRGSF